MGSAREFVGDLSGSVRPLGAAVLCAGLALGMPDAARAECRFSVMTLPVEMVGMRPVATVGINGRPVRLVVDSGAFYSALTRDAARQLGLPERTAPRILFVDDLAGAFDARLTTVRRLQFGIVELPNVDFLVGMAEPGADAVGVLGRNLLGVSNADTEYDLAHGVIRVVYPNHRCGGQDYAYWAGEGRVSELAMIGDRDVLKPAAVVVARVNGHEAKALLDTSAPTLLSRAQAGRAEIPADALQSAGSLRGAGNGVVRTWVTSIGKFELDMETLVNYRFRVADFDLDGVDMLLGIDFFLSHHVYVANSQHRVFFTSNGDWALPPGAERAAPIAGGDAALTLQSSIDPNARQYSLAPPSP